MRPSRPQGELQAIAQIAAWAEHGWTAYETTEAILAAPTLRAAGEPGRSTEVPDPTYAIVQSLETFNETTAMISECLGLARAIQRRMSIVKVHHPNIAREADVLAKNLRCDGTVDPTCTRNAVRGGKCWACIKAAQRATEEKSA